MKFNKEWIIGFIEGEGCFQYKEYNRIQNKYQVLQRLASFYIGLQPNDYDLLKGIHTHLDFGKLYLFKSMCQWKISSKEDRTKLIKFIDSTSGFKGSKKKQYEEWKEKVYILDYKKLN